MRAWRTIKKVEASGEVRIDALPFPKGQEVEIIVLPIEDDLRDLTAAAESGLGFWDNDIDDEVWNDALPSA